eukprot:7078948-Karenia_brevis.AAC.1
MPDEVYQYMTCSWRSEDVSLLDYLRRTNKSGRVSDWLRHKHKRAVAAGETEALLETFALEYPLFGEQLIAADMLSWRNDKHCGQWLMLNVPFRNPEEFFSEKVDRLVPLPYRYLAMA